MALSTLQGSYYFPGSVIFASITLPGSSVVDGSVTAAANISASKLEHQYQKTYRQSFSEDVVPDRAVIHRVYGASGSIVDFVAGAVTAAGAASTCTVDLLKNGVSVLTSVITLSSSHAAFELVSPVGYSNTSLSADDVLEVKIASVSGSNLPKGVFADVVIRERAQ